MEEKECKTCPICYDPLNNNKVIGLECGHVFHYKCIYDIFRHELKNAYHSATRRKKRICPFCRYKCGPLPTMTGFIPIKYVTENANFFYEELNKNNYELIENYFNPEKCHCLLKSGQNKGLQCSKKKVNDSLYCRQHVKISNKEKDSD
jgi:hypothetical protein